MEFSSPPPGYPRVYLPSAEGKTKGGPVPLSETSFAVRKVDSCQRGDNKFHAIDDWSPEQIMSRASRHYIVGHIFELKELCAHLASFDTHIAELLAECSIKTDGLSPSLLAFPHNKNTLLFSGVNLGMSGAPEFVIPKPLDPTLVKKLGQDSPLTVEEVHVVLIEKCGVTEKKLKRVSCCLKRAMLMKHVDVTAPDFGRDTLVLESVCTGCNQPLKATVGNILFQLDYAGTDYEEDGQNASIHCKKCKSGNYVSFLCMNEPEFNSGKSHNHCKECSDFGQCIGDYRQTHCQVCGSHFFAGSMGSFSCHDCGAKDEGFGWSKRKGVPLADMPFPSPDMFDGQVAGIGKLAGMKFNMLYQLRAFQEEDPDFFSALRSGYEEESDDESEENAD